MKKLHDLPERVTFDFALGHSEEVRPGGVVYITQNRVTWAVRHSIELQAAIEKRETITVVAEMVR